MKQFLVWCFALLYSIPLFAQKQTVFEQVELHVVIPEIEKFYQTNFSYTNQLIHNKKVSILLDEIVPIESLLLSLSSQTDLKFEQISDKNIVISPFTSTDLITVCGQLQCNNKTIANAIINVNNKIYFSDEQGHFKITDVPHNANINISSFGIKNTTLIAAEHTFPNCITINLIEKLEKLDQIIIDEYIASGISKNVKQTTINTQKVKLLPGLIEPDILESIHQIPGVSNLNETVNSIHVRGGKADENLVLWNNIKTYGSSHMFGAISAFNPYITNKVHFINKGTNPKYGERISSVIAINSNYKPTNKVSGGAGFNMLHADAFVNTPLLKDKLSIQVSGRRSYADALETFTYKNYAANIFQNTKIYGNNSAFSQSKNIFWFYDYTLNAAWKVGNKNLFKINHIYSKDYLNFSAFNNDKSNLYADVLNTKNNGTNFVWEKEWSPKVSHQTDVYFSEYQLDYQYTDQSNIGVFKNAKENHIKDYGLNFNLRYDLEEYKQFNLGYQFSNKNIKYTFNNSSPTEEKTLASANNTTNSNSLYTEYQINKPKDFLYTLGLRANTYNNFKRIYLEPRAVVQKYVIPEFSINASVEYKSQYVNQVQESVFNNLSLENYIWSLSDTNNFPVLTSYQYTIGVNYSKNKWIVDFEAYFKKTNNINSLNFDFTNQNLHEYHIGSSSIQGVDLFLKKQLKNYNTWLSYSFNSANYRFPELNNGKPFPSNVNINHTIKWSHFYQWKNFNFTLGWLWHNGKPYTKINSTINTDNTTSYSYTQLNNENLHVYHRLDFSAVYDFRPHKNKYIKYRLGLSVLNLYNRKNTINKELRFSNTAPEELHINDVRGTKISPNLVLRVFW